MRSWGTSSTTWGSWCTCRRTWNLLATQVISPSTDEKLGHEFNNLGQLVYVSPHVATATGYARPQNVFGDGVLFRCVLELRVDANNAYRKKQSGGTQWTFEAEQVRIVGVWVCCNCGNEKGTDHLRCWQQDLEIIPVGVTEAGCVPRMVAAEAGYSCDTRWPIPGTRHPRALQPSTADVIGPDGACWCGPPASEAGAARALPESKRGRWATAANTVNSEGSSGTSSAVAAGVVPAAAASAETEKRGLCEQWAVTFSRIV
eukprot:s2421_g21.t1